METDRRQQSVLKMQCALGLIREIVGVKFLLDRKQFEEDAAGPVKRSLNYCVMVRMAAQGRVLKATGDSLACLAGARALGLTPVDDYHRSGRNGLRLGLYRDQATSKNARDAMSYCDHRAYGVAVKPLRAFADEPDVVIIVADPYSVMRIVQGYSYHYGVRTGFKMTGNQAICSESTAYPYLSGDINVSMLCIGTRHRAGWKDEELAVAFPFNRFQLIVDGVMETINIMDSDEKKVVIEKRLAESGIDDIAIRYGCNYYNNPPAPDEEQEKGGDDRK